jgi:hypothetical protein
MARSRSHRQRFDTRSCYLSTRYCGVSDPGLAFRRRQLMAVANRFRRPALVTELESKLLVAKQDFLALFHQALVLD